MTDRKNKANNSELIQLINRQTLEEKIEVEAKHGKTSVKRGKTCERSYWCQARGKNVTGATGAKRGETCNRCCWCQARENM